MSALLDMLSQSLGFAGDVLDTPGRFTRTALAGRNPFASVFDPSQGASGRDMLEAWGMGENQEGLDAGDVLGFGAEVLTDPANWVGAGAIGKTMRAAGAATDANKASEAMRAMGAMPEEVAKLTKVVDDAGSPLRTYHGTNAVFDKYDPKMSENSLFSSGIYTTSNPDLSNIYADSTAMYSPWDGKPINTRMQYMDMRNPVDLEDPAMIELKRGLLDDELDFKTIPDRLKSMGYDGIMRSEEGSPVYMAFDPSQIYSPYIAPAMQNVPSTSPLLAALAGYNAAMLPERGN